MNKKKKEPNMFFPISTRILLILALFAAFLGGLFGKVMGVAFGHTIATIIYAVIGVVALLPLMSWTTKPLMMTMRVLGALLLIVIPIVGVFSPETAGMLGVIALIFGLGNIFSWAMGI